MVMRIEKYVTRKILKSSGWMDGWMGEVSAVLWIAHSNKKFIVLLGQIKFVA
jgi:hypothetical protein